MRNKKGEDVYSISTLCTPPPRHKDKLTDRHEESRTYKGSSPLEIYKYKGAKVPPQSFH